MRKMRRMGLIVAAVLAVCVLGYFVARATSYVFIGNLLTVNGTTNSTAVNLGTFSAPRGTFYIQNGGLTATNALVVYVQASIDNTNWLTVATYYPTRTNATTDVFSPAISPTLYFRGQVVTTNAVQIGGTWSYP